MAQVIADRRDVDFVLHEQLKVEELAKHGDDTHFPGDESVEPVGERGGREERGSPKLRLTITVKEQHGHDWDGCDPKKGEYVRDIPDGMGLKLAGHLGAGSPSFNWKHNFFDSSILC